jgi:hypothetical protein
MGRLYNSRSKDNMFSYDAPVNSGTPYEHSNVRLRLGRKSFSLFNLAMAFPDVSMQEYVYHFEQELVAEAGHSWENFVFGGKLTRNNHPGLVLDENRWGIEEQMGCGMSLFVELWPSAFIYGLDEYVQDRPFRDTLPECVVRWRIETAFIIEAFHDELLGDGSSTE